MSGFLPEEIMENKFTRSPVKSISRFRCVSKYWYHLFRNPNFIKNHLNHANLMNNFKILVSKYDTSTEPCISSADNSFLSSTSSPFLVHDLNIDYPFKSREFVPKILGSCNGLLCIEPFPGSICIWNPATREYKLVPEPPADLDLICYRAYRAYGIGYDCKTDDYKVVRIVGFSEVSEASLYSLASNSWKKLGSIPYGFKPIDFYFDVNKGRLHNGVLHWMATGINSNVIVCFDISDETFHEVPLPNNISNEDDDPYDSDLGIWEGKLCILHRNHMHIDVWTTMDDNWSKPLKITAQISDVYYGRPLQTLQNGEILLLGLPMVEEGLRLISYDPKLERAAVTKIHGFPEEFEVETYIETLVALNSGTYVGQ